MRRDVFQAIADPTRRDILALVEREAMTPKAIAAHFKMSRQAISRHLRILTECQMVRQMPRGREIYYRLDMEKLEEIDRWLDQFSEAWLDRFKELDHIFFNNKNQ